MRDGSQQPNWWEVPDPGNTLGQTLSVFSISTAPSPALTSSLLALHGLVSLLMLPAPGTVIFCGYRLLG